MSKITPGDWIQKASGVEGLIYIVSKDGRPVAEVPDYGYDEMEAIARAIVEVPELIKAAKDFQNSLTFMWTEEEERAGHERITALLARIEGKETTKK